MHSQVRGIDRKPGPPRVRTWKAQSTNASPAEGAFYHTEIKMQELLNTSNGKILTLATFPLVLPHQPHPEKTVHAPPVGKSTKKSRIVDKSRGWVG